MAKRAPLVTLKPLSLIALVNSPDKITFTSLIELLINPASRNTFKSITSADLILQVHLDKFDQLFYLHEI